MTAKREKVNNQGTLGAFSGSAFPVVSRVVGRVPYKIWDKDGSEVAPAGVGMVGTYSRPLGDAEQERAEMLARVNGPEVTRGIYKAAHGKVRHSIRWRTPRLKARDWGASAIRFYFGFMAVSPAGRLRQSGDYLRRAGYGKQRGARSDWRVRRTALEWLGDDVESTVAYAQFVLTVCRKRARTPAEQVERRGLLEYIGTRVAPLREVAYALPVGSFDLLGQLFFSANIARSALRLFLVKAPEQVRKARRLCRPARRGYIPRPPDLLPCPPSAPLAPPA